ncbi:hypothetical protein NWO25_02115 [Enterococcus lactis]|nr:hypothetical protein [Enterococcus lactis]
MIIEQAVRVIVILAGTYYLRVLTDGTILEAVLISTVASFFGGLAAIIHMYIVGRRKDFFELKDFLISSRYFERETDLPLSLSFGKHYRSFLSAPSLLSFK